MQYSFVEVEIEQPGKRNIRGIAGKTVEFLYPCDSDEECVPYKIKLEPGKYQFECIGGSTSNSVRGAYTSGKIEISNKNNTFYLFLGSKAYFVRQNTNHYYYNSFNGGSGGKVSSSSVGSGATDIRLVNGKWNNFDSLKSRIMVAAGSGGSDCSAGGAGGSLTGKPGKVGKCSDGTSAQNPGNGAAQNYGTFGYAVSGSQNAIENVNGGGGGYYGGYRSQDGGAGGGGGSSFISGFYGCDAISENSTSDNIIHTNQSIHYSKLKFIDPVMLDGDEAIFYSYINPIDDLTGSVRITKLISDSKSVGSQFMTLCVCYFLFD